MKNIHSLSILTIAAAVSSIPLYTTEAAPTPYTADANTLHLWHFDDADPGPSTNAVAEGFNLDAAGGAILGSAGFPGFGNTGNTSANTGSGFRSSDPVAVSSVTGVDGAFTFEAMIKTSSITSGNQMIVSMEANGGIVTRPFQFRINGVGQLQLNNVASAASPPPVAIPTTGDDAFVADEWFHVAVTYTGAEGEADNFKFYWTKVDATRTAANEIVSLQMTADLTGNNAVFGVGNDYRTVGTGNTNNIKGSIDEVRISNIARGADEFIFSNGTPVESFAINAIQYTPGTNIVTLTWNSIEGENYTVKASQDLNDWVQELEDTIPADPGAETSWTFDLTDTGLEDSPRLFFRVER